MLLETTQTPLQNIRYHINVEEVSLLKLLYIKLVQGILTCMHLLNSKVNMS